jgi:hypothetical protein
MDTQPGPLEIGSELFFKPPSHRSRRIGPPITTLSTDVPLGAGDGLMQPQLSHQCSELSSVPGFTDADEEDHQINHQIQDEGSTIVVEPCIGIQERRRR